ncbi:serine threonine-protein kinase [Musa troglodytarum]|uniref:Serine threonine-protein kinase n=1 Tax=Musa troglodytarum TaxID=320322 RepID=A0A9E7EFI1_9LILI|nr:serine threonine-protein kinase [Musa troglodytarum]
MIPSYGRHSQRCRCGREFGGVLTTVRGTFGYLARERITGSATVAPKADVDSFEIGLRRAKYGRDAKTWISSTALSGRQSICMKATTLSLLDPKLKGNADEKELGRACRMAWWCIQDVECRRPSTGEVVEQQEGELGVSLPPISGLLRNLFVDDVLAEKWYFGTISYGKTYLDVCKKLWMGVVRECLMTNHVEPVEPALVALLL